MLTTVATLHLDKNTNPEIEAMRDTEVQKCLILEHLILQQFWTKLNIKLAIKTCDNNTHQIDHCIHNIPISIGKVTFTLPETLIVSLRDTSNF